MTLGEFLEQYPPRQPSKPPENADEHRLLTEVDGVRRLPSTPQVTGARPPTRKGDPDAHLWVFEESGAPYILEMARVEPPLQSGRVKHTNLTGGGAASCGGEIWFETPTRVFMHGSSGRYPPSRAQFEDAVRVMKGFGFDVVSFGWDVEQDRPEIVLR